MLDGYGLTLEASDGCKYWLSLRQIIQAVAEDEEVRKLIGTAILSAPIPPPKLDFTACNVGPCEPWNSMADYVSPVYSVDNGT